MSDRMLVERALFGDMSWLSLPIKEPIESPPPGRVAKPELSRELANGEVETGPREGCGGYGVPFEEDGDGGGMLRGPKEGGGGSPGIVPRLSLRRCCALELGRKGSLF